MAYTPTQWVNGQPPALNAANLNKIEQGIADNEQELSDVKKDLSSFKIPFINKIVKSPNKIAELLNGAMFSGNGNFVPASENPAFSGWWTSNYIEVEPSKTYCLSESGIAKGVSTSALFDANKNHIAGDVFVGEKVTATSNAKYVRFSIQRSSKPTELQFEEGSNVTSYVPFGEYVLTLKVDELLYKSNKYIELVECDNLYGAYITNNFNPEKPSFTGYATKVFDVTGIDSVKLSGGISQYVNAITLLDENKDIIAFEQTSTYTTYDNKKFDVSNACFVAVSSIANNFWNDNRIKLYGNKTIDSRWNNKKIVWFGTSIPAGGYKGNENDYGYPYLVGRRLGAKVYNEAVGSSPLHGRQLARVSATNPYGFMAAFEPASRALCNTLEQMQWIANWIDYKLNGGTYKNDEEWDPNVFTSGLPASWSEQNTADLLSFSFENKLDQYLTNETFADLFVLDHGYNDDVNWSDELGYYERDFDTYGRYNPFTFQGSANFIIDRILAFNPHAKIVMIGCYDKSLPTKKNVHKWQSAVADDNQLPLLKLWEKTGLTQTVLSLNGKWVNGLWQETTTTQTYTVMNANLPDTIHPHSDKSGRMLRFLADIIYPYIRDC